MKKLFIILLLTAFIIILNDCKEYECEAYINPGVWDSLPFKRYDTVSYISQNGQIQSFYIYEMKIDAVKDCDANDNCHCETYFQIGTPKPLLFNNDVIYNLSAQIQDGINITWILFLFYSLEINYYYPKFETDTVRFTKVNDTITVNNTFYSGVNIIEVDTINYKTYRVYKVWVHKKYGIIKYCYRAYPYNTIFEWNLIR